MQTSKRQSRLEEGESEGKAVKDREEDMESGSQKKAVSWFGPCRASRYSDQVITVGPLRPVRSWMLEIFRAMAIRGPRTT